jgi:RNA polymerase sigma-70 factor (ECF subfamily)
MSTDDTFPDLVARLRSGDADAAQEIFRRFARRLIGLARLRLDARLQQKVDPEDVVQSVFRSFFVRHAGGEFDLHGWDSLWSLLTVITLRKCGHKLEYFHAACRDVRRETAPATEQEDSLQSWQGIAREPTPDEAAQLADTVAQLIAALAAEDRSLVELALQGHTAAEISAQCGVAERTVYRRLERIKSRLERQRTSDGLAG